MSKRIDIEQRLWIRRAVERRKGKRRVIHIDVTTDKRVSNRRRVQRRKKEKRNVNERRKS